MLEVALQQIVEQVASIMKTWLEKSQWTRMGLADWVSLIVNQDIYEELTVR